MVSRRILRIKIMQALYAYYKHDGESTISKAENELLFSVQKSYDLYHYLLLIILDIADYASSRIDLALQKRIPTQADLHPNNRFIENKLLIQLRNNENLLRYLSIHKLSWVKHPELIKGLYQSIIESPEYESYMSSTSPSYEEDKSFICEIYLKIIAEHEALYLTLEEQSIFWNDEVDYILSNIIKTLKKFKATSGEDIALLPLYKSDDDEIFAKTLLRKVILNHDEYRELIEHYSKNWDVDRIAFMDILLMEMAIAEAIEFSSIPVKVSMNEYLDLSKYYSTPKSNLFINGILDKVFLQLKEEKRIEKKGRGLIGEG